MISIDAEKIVIKTQHTLTIKVLENVGLQRPRLGLWKLYWKAHRQYHPTWRKHEPIWLKPGVSRGPSLSALLLHTVLEVLDEAIMQEKEINRLIPDKDTNIIYARKHFLQQIVVSKLDSLMQKNLDPSLTSCTKTVSSWSPPWCMCRKGLSEQESVCPRIKANSWHLDSHKTKKPLHSKRNSRLRWRGSPEKEKESLPARHLTEAYYP